MSVDVAGWRGVAAEGTEDAGAELSGFLRARSRRLLGSLLRPHGRSLAVAAVLVVLYNGAVVVGPLLVRLAIDRGIPPLQRGDGAGTLVAVVAAFAAVSMFAAGTHYSLTALSGRIGQEVLLDLRTRLFDHFQRLSIAFHERYTSGRVISRLTSDIEAISELLSFGLQSLVSALLSLAGVAVLMIFLDLPLAAVALGVLPFVVALTVWFRINAIRAYRATRQAIALVIVHFVESLGGIRAVQAFRREPRNQEIFEAVNDRYRLATMRSMRLTSVYGPGVKLLGNFATAAILLVGGWRVLEGDITVGVLAAFLLYLRRLFEPVQELSQFYNVFQAAASALENLSGVLEEQPSVAEPARPVALPQAAGQVGFEHVTFGYRDRPVVADLHLALPAGQTVALVGPTGAGKTTIARLIARFYDPDAGRVLLDGIDLRDLSSTDLRRAVVTVTQEAYLFNGSVADNIALGRPTAGRREIEEAARAIGADGFIAALPDGYDTDVRRRGGRLSAGQRQLVSFARAFLADPRVLILDEATSSLDLPSERLVQRALRTLLADRTAVIIAHRLSTVEIADRVLVIDAGRVVEDGAPAELLATSGRYQTLHQSWLESLV